MDNLFTEPYKDDSQMPAIMALLEKDLSEPYTIYTYRVQPPNTVLCAQLPVSMQTDF
jgi:hypothetical protein